MMAQGPLRWLSRCAAWRRQDGVTHLVATPHSNYTYTFDPDLNRQLLAELQEKVGEKPKLLLGCDFHLSYDNIQICAQNSKDFTINQTSYLLVELPDQFIPDHLSRVYYDIQVAGLKPDHYPPGTEPPPSAQTGAAGALGFDRMPGASHGTIVHGRVRLQSAQVCGDVARRRAWSTSLPAMPTT